MMVISDRQHRGLLVPPRVMITLHIQSLSRDYFRTKSVKVLGERFKNVVTRKQWYKHSRDDNWSPCDEDWSEAHQSQIKRQSVADL